MESTAARLGRHLSKEPRAPSAVRLSFYDDVGCLSSFSFHYTLPGILQGRGLSGCGMPPRMS